MCHLSCGSGAVSARGPESWQEALYFWNNHDKWKEKSIGESLLCFRDVILLILICMLSVVSSILFLLQPLDACVCGAGSRDGGPPEGVGGISLAGHASLCLYDLRLWGRTVRSEFTIISRQIIFFFLFFWPFTFSAPQTWCVWAARKTT